MLIPLQEKDFDKYIDFAYELALDPARSFYPVYFDGIKTKADFIAEARRAFTSPTREILLYQADGAVEGWLHYFYWPEDHYLQLYTSCIRRNAAGALEELSGYLAARYPGYDWLIGFPAENREAKDWAEGAGFCELDDAQNYSFFFDRYDPVPDDPSVERITEENFEKFQRVHRTIEDDMYWNSRRVREKLSQWNLFVAEENGIAGEVMANFNGSMCEIFALACEDGQFHERLYRRLLTRFLNEGKRQGSKYMTFFVGTDDEMNRLMPELDFHLVGRYLAYRKRI
ncbi:MAG: hypothetical protein HFF69_12245 [Oscillospiraceae bacterium]|jgi:hypothetical protein|nr:hypothetical protein [Oscillospiraceae bacterium]